MAVPWSGELLISGNTKRKHFGDLVKDIPGPNYEGPLTPRCIGKPGHWTRHWTRTVALSAGHTSEPSECFKEYNACPPTSRNLDLVGLEQALGTVSCWAILEPDAKEKLVSFHLNFWYCYGFLHSFWFFTYCIVASFIFVSEGLCVCSHKFCVLVRWLMSLTLPQPCRASALCKAPHSGRSKGQPRLRTTDWLSAGCLLCFTVLSRVAATWDCWELEILVIETEMCCSFPKFSTKNKLFQ